MKLFDGIAGAAIARVMAISNADMERAAIDALAPRARDAVLEIGFGPGVGIEMLARRADGGLVAGVDPSSAMLRSAERRNRASIRDGRVELRIAHAHQLPFAGASFDGAIAVNSMQLWDPLDASVAELARVLRPGAAFVALTHRWAIEKYARSDEWLDRTRVLMLGSGLSEWRTWSGKARSGATVGLAVRKREG